ncbi:MAG: polysaccharide deacetylase family protein [Burkholderiaceae bacterium]
MTDLAATDDRMPERFFGGNFRWPNGARLALSIVVNVEEGSEQTVADGDRGPDPVDELGVALRRPIRNYGNESNYRYGIGPGFERVAGLLEQYRMPTTWACAALALERAPHVADFIRQHGHETCSHGWRWIHHFHLDEASERDFIDRAVQSIEKTTGRRPVGWLSRYLHTERTRRLLVEAGFEYHMDDYSDDRPFWSRTEAGPIVVMPYALDSNDMKFWTAPSLAPATWTDYAIRSFEWLRQEGASQPRMMSLGLHLRIIGRPGRIDALRQFLDHVARCDDVWVATRADIARAYAAAIPAPENT